MLTFLQLRIRDDDNHLCIRLFVFPGSLSSLAIISVTPICCIRSQRFSSPVSWRYHTLLQRYYTVLQKLYKGNTLFFKGTTLFYKGTTPHCSTHKCTYNAILDLHIRPLHLQHQPFITNTYSTNRESVCNIVLHISYIYIIQQHSPNNLYVWLVRPLCMIPRSLYIPLCNTHMLEDTVSPLCMP